MSSRRFVCYLMVGVVAGGLIWWGEQSNKVNDEYREEFKPTTEATSNTLENAGVQQEDDEHLFQISMPFVSVGIL